MMKDWRTIDYIVPIPFECDFFYFSHRLPMYTDEILALCT